MAKQPVKKKTGVAFSSDKLGALNKYKEKNNLGEVKQKEQEWLVFDDNAAKALEESIATNAFPLCEVTSVLGHSNTGKTSIVLEAIKACQKQGVVPVLFDLETSIKWNHAKEMGINVTEFVDEETGELNYGPPEEMIFYNPSLLYEQYKLYNHDEGKYEAKSKRDNYCIADVALCIREILRLQKEENWDFNLYFIIDSIGVGESYRSAVANKTNNMWYAGEFTTSFNVIGNDLIPACKYVSSKWSNGMLLINKVSVETTFTGIKVAKAKGSSFSGDYLRRYSIFLGNQGSSGAKAEGVTYNGDFYECARVINISIIKNHITSLTREGKIVTTKDGIIPFSQLAAYKEEFKKWLKNELSKKHNKTISDGDLIDEEREITD